MDESFFGLKMSNFVNKIFGAKEIQVVENEYVSENLARGNNKNQLTASSNNDAPSSYKSRRIGFGFGPMIQIMPFIGNYIVLAINVWILYCMIGVGLGYKIHFEGKKLKIKQTSKKKFIKIGDVGKMIFNIIVDFGIGFIPIVGGFISIIHRSSSRNLAIFWKSMERTYVSE